MEVCPAHSARASGVGGVDDLGRHRGSVEVGAVSLWAAFQCLWTGAGAPAWASALSFAGNGSAGGRPRGVGVPAAHAEQQAGRVSRRCSLSSAFQSCP